MIENQTLQVTQKDSAPKLIITKQSFRKQVWDHLKTNKICTFPSPFGRIPNFKGAHQAASQLMNLEEFELAKSVEVNPDKPLEPSRILVLENGKELFVPVPRLQENLLKQLIPQNGLTTKKIVSRWGIEHTGIKIDLDSKIHIDLIVVGSVAVSKEGYRIGKGKGYADLEFALLKEINAIDDNTLIVTTVHDSQVFDELPKDLFKKYDVPVDYILTPTRIIKVEKKLPRPTGIFWDLLSQTRLNQIEILRNLKLQHEREGKLIPNIIESNIETHSTRSQKKNKGNKMKSDVLNVEQLKENEENTSKQKNNIKWNSNVTKLIDNENIPPPSPRRKRSKHPIDFSLLIGNIERNVRVKDLKKALVEKGIKPDSITWKGYRGFCYLHYSARTNKRDPEKREPFSIDNVIEILQGLKIIPTSKQNLTVKVVEPITRIETTDVTAV
ncbi:methenyltetrahydrofolate synthase domain-containing protein [Anoplophora glabripennis]|uniref:methenyltetrahydrofolate synthase domain-containing protein n=1 Tax=Anoplophora glabripennis TaxID=217634 RepID=UPI0008747EDE|nr:methenyltetrahydrofolate synthase domain-containing protein [Anoplophora glabripennis]